MCTELSIQGLLMRGSRTVFPPMSGDIAERGHNMQWGGLLRTQHAVGWPAVDTTRSGVAC